MRIVLHIGLPVCGADRLQSVLDDKRGALAKAGVLYSGLGRLNHTKLYMAVSDPGHIDPLRFARGFASSRTQEALRDRVAEDLAAEVKRAAPDVLVLSALQLSTRPMQANCAVCAPCSPRCRTRSRWSPMWTNRPGCSCAITRLRCWTDGARIWDRNWA